MKAVYRNEEETEREDAEEQKEEGEVHTTILQ